MVRKGLFRRDRISGPSYILRGLRLKATGRGNADGQLVANNIRFDEQDLRTAQALESRVDPVETQANATGATTTPHPKPLVREQWVGLMFNLESSALFEPVRLYYR